MFFVSQKLDLDFGDPSNPWIIVAVYDKYELARQKACSLASKDPNKRFSVLATVYSCKGNVIVAGEKHAIKME